MTTGGLPPFAALLQRHRMRAGLTQEGLAERAGLSARGISDLERGIKIRPHSYTVRQLADALHLTPGDRVAFEDAASQRVSDRHEAKPLPIGAFLGARPSGVLVGRSEELGRIVTAIEAVETGQGMLVVLAGEAGAGKTRLAQETALVARARGFVVGAGRCYEPEQQVPFCPFVEALSQLYTTCASPVRAEIPERWPYLGRLLPEEAIAPPVTGPDGQEEQLRLFRAVTGFIRGIAEAAPVAVMLDDLHWADGSSLRLLMHLARHTTGDRVLLLGTYRDIEAERQGALEAALRDLDRDGLVQRFKVRLLGREETTALIASMGVPDPPAALAETVYRLTDGNPFFIQHLLRSMLERGDLERQGSGWSYRSPEAPVLPETIRSVIRHRFSYLGDQAQEILHEASVLGHRFSFGDLRGMSGRTEDEVEEALEAADAIGLVRLLDADEYGFDHALTHSALLADLSPRKKRRLHLAAGEAMESAGGVSTRAAEVAWHFLQGGAEERALPAVLLAGDGAAAVFAHGEAEGHYRLALDLAHGMGSDAQAALALEKLAGALRSTGRLGEAFDAFERALTLYQVLGDLEGEGRVTARIAEIQVERGALEEGRARALSVLARLEKQGSSPALAALHLALAPQRDTGRDPREYLAHIERASQLARELGDDGILARAGVRRGMILMALGYPEEARRVLEEVTPQIESAGDYRTRILGSGVLAELLKLAGEFEPCRAILARLVQVAEQAGDPAWLVGTMAPLGEILFLLGDWQQARLQLSRAAELAHVLVDRHLAAFALLGLAQLELGAGNQDEAGRYLETCLADAQRAGDHHIARHARRLLSHRDLLDGRPHEARRRLQQLAQEENHPATLSALARAYLESGQGSQAADACTKAKELATTRDNGLDLCEALLVQAAVSVHLDRYDEAESALRQALALAEAMPHPYAKARILYERGLMHLREAGGGDAGQRQVMASTSLHEALRIFRRLGAVPDIERTGRAIAGCSPSCNRLP